ncbi:hypothetical protein [Xanthomonas axonopodis]
MFESLFRQFRTKAKAADGSRWMHLHGHLLIGSVESKGLGALHPDVIRTYYYFKKDRYPMDGVMTMKEWGRDCQRADIRRRIESSYVGVYACILSTALISAMLATFMILSGLGSLGGKVSGAVGLKPTYESCKAQYQKAFTTNSEVNPKCQQVMEEAGEL